MNFNLDDGVKRIGYDNGRFLIKCPTYEFDRIRLLPNRRWSKSKRIWSAPAIRANAAIIESKLTDFEITPSAEDALQRIRDAQRLRIKKPDFPADFQYKTQPFKHQEDATEFAHMRPTVALFMDMGTGKTKVGIDVYGDMIARDAINGVLVICPYSIRQNWANEIQMHSAHSSSVFILDNDEKKYKKWLKAPGQRWMIVAVESLAQGRAFTFCDRFLLEHRGAVVIDESSKIKNHKAQRTQRCISLGKLVKHRMIMTGTPITQSVMDLYAPFEFLDPEIIGIGDFYSFRNQYAVMGGFDNRTVIGYQNLDELFEVLDPHIFQVRKKDVLKDLPEKMYSTRSVRPTDAQRALIDKIRNEAFENGEKISVRNVLERQLRLHQVAAGFYVPEADVDEESKPIPISPNPKIIELMEVLDEADPEQKAVIWCNYREQLNQVIRAVSEAHGPGSVARFDGTLKADERQQQLDEFQNGPRRFMVGITATGGFGLNMTAASLVIYMSNSFKLEERLQSEDRVHRIGQANRPLYVDIKLVGTIDDIVIRALSMKMDLAEYVRRHFDKGGTLKEII